MANDELYVDDWGYLIRRRYDEWGLPRCSVHPYGVVNMGGCWDAQAWNDELAQYITLGRCDTRAEAVDFLLTTYRLREGGNG